MDFYGVKFHSHQKKIRCPVWLTCLVYCIKMELNVVWMQHVWWFEWFEHAKYPLFSSKQYDENGGIWLAGGQPQRVGILQSELRHGELGTPPENTPDISWGTNIIKHKTIRISHEHTQHPLNWTPTNTLCEFLKCSRPLLPLLLCLLVNRGVYLLFDENVGMWLWILVFVGVCIGFVDIVVFERTLMNVAGFLSIYCSCRCVWWWCWRVLVFISEC